MGTIREGGCLCGKVRYRITGEPLTLYACHCTDCQRHGASSFGLSMIVPRREFELLRGEPRDYAVTVSEGHERRGKFCAECATRLWGEPLRFPQVVVLRPGTLDDTTWIEPVAHIWTRSAQPWVSIPEGALSFETQPEDTMVLIDAWRNRGDRTRGRVR